MDFTLIVSALLFGFAAGILFAVCLLLRHTRACEDDCANHLHAACELSLKLAEERQKNEHLTTQVDGLLSSDPAGGVLWINEAEPRDIKQISLS